MGYFTDSIGQHQIGEDSDDDSRSQSISAGSAFYGFDREADTDDGHAHSHTHSLNHTHDPSPSPSPSPSTFWKNRHSALSEVDQVSPRTAATATLTQPTVPDFDTMTSSFRPPTDGKLDALPQNDEYPSSSRPRHLTDADHLPSLTTTLPLARMMPNPSPSPSLLPPDRPPLLSVNSSSPLLGDVSGNNTPVSPVERDPFSDASLRRGTSASSFSSETDTIPPKIHINSIPNSPVSPAMPSFTPTQTFATPSADLRSRFPSRSQQGRATGTNASLSGTPTQSLHSTGVQSRSTIAQRRSQRMKAGKNGKKEKDGREGKVATAQMSRKPFESTRLKGEIYKPWLEKKDPAQRWARYITIASIFLGFAICGVSTYSPNTHSWLGVLIVVQSVGTDTRRCQTLGKRECSRSECMCLCSCETRNRCLILDDNFSNGLNLDTWTREVRLDGYGNGEFEWTTNSDNNSFVKDGTLYLVPTLTSDVLGAEAISNGYTLNLTADGTCTSKNVSQCVAVSNSSQLTVINPVQSARLTTQNSVSLRYGRIEVTAKFPTGDWLWPGIFLLPVNETYGAWPRSGEIDILEGRGNNMSYPNRGVDYAQSSLHWGEQLHSRATN